MLKLLPTLSSLLHRQLSGRIVTWWLFFLGISRDPASALGKLPGTVHMLNTQTSPYLSLKHLTLLSILVLSVLVFQDSIVLTGHSLSVLITGFSFYGELLNASVVILSLIPFFSLKSLKMRWVTSFACMASTTLIVKIARKILYICKLTSLLSLQCIFNFQVYYSISYLTCS